MIQVSRPATLTTLCAVFVLFALLATIAHLHPDVDLGFLPSGRLFMDPIVVHPVFQPENRQLDFQQCQEAYPRLYYEADRAREWYAGQGGITERQVEAAVENGGHARLAIINNQASQVPPSVCRSALDA